MILYVGASRGDGVRMRSGTDGNKERTVTRAMVKPLTQSKALEKCALRRGDAVV